MTSFRNKSKVKVTGNTYVYRKEIAKLAPATFDKVEKCWVLDLSGISNTAAAKIEAEAYKLSKLGVKFEAE